MSTSNIRLNPHEVAVIRDVLLGFDPKARITLFGSRTDTHKRGGDIDLMLEPTRHVSQREAIGLEYLLQTACDCKVDLLVKQPNSASQPIHMIASQGIVL